MKPRVYLDLDGCVTDFLIRYNELSPMMDNKQKFKTSVSRHEIFRELPMMPNAHRLIQLLFRDLDVDVEILSSLGTHDPEISAMAQNQKEYWLAKNGIDCPRNFVKSWAYKQNYATPTAIMIDDRLDVAETFAEKGGLSVLYNDNDWGQMDYKIRQAVARSNQIITLGNS